VTVGTLTLVIVTLFDLLLHSIPVAPIDSRQEIAIKPSLSLPQGSGPSLLESFELNDKHFKYTTTKNPSLQPVVSLVCRTIAFRNQLERLGNV